MGFSEFFKKEMDEKYASMLSGKTTYPISATKLTSFDEFKKNNESVNGALNAMESDARKKVNTIAKDVASRYQQDQANEAERRRREQENERKRREAAEEAERRRRREEQERKERTKRILKIVIPIVVIAAIILSIVIGVVSCNAKKEKEQQQLEQSYSCEHVLISTSGKTESMSGSKYVSKITFTVQNNSVHKIRTVYGNMDFYYGNTKLGNGNITFDKDISASSSGTITIEFSGYDEIYQKLYNTPYDNLGLTYQITGIYFDDSSYTSRTYDNAEVKWIKKASSNTPSTMPIKVQEVYLDQSSSTIKVGDTLTLTASVYPDNATNKSIEWSSSNPSVATVNSNGKVTAVSEGDAIIYATNNDSGCWAGCEISVYQDYPDFTFTSTSYSYYSAIKVSSYRGSESVITIPAKYKSNSVVVIGSQLFQNYTSLTSITIPASIKKIDTDAFSGCSNLTKVYFNGTIDEWAQIEFTNYLANPLYNGADLYINGSKVVNATISCSIAKSAFAGSTIKTLNVTGGYSIGAGAFYKCNSLETVQITGEVGTINESAFNSCANLTTISLPSSLNYIYDSAFRYCTNLTRINYAAQKSWWNAISKGSRWNGDTGAYTIYCTDGTITK